MKKGNNINIITGDNFISPYSIQKSLDHIFKDNKSTDNILSNASIQSSVENIIKNSGGKVIEIAKDVLLTEITKTYNNIINILSQLELKNEKLFVHDVSFTLGFDSTGKVGLFSTISGEATNKVGITFNITMK